MVQSKTLVIQSFATTRGGDLLFFARDEDGRSVLCHGNFFRLPRLDTESPDPDNWGVEPGDWAHPKGVHVGTFVRGICELADMGPRTIAWCLESEYQRCLLKLAAKRREIEDTAAERLATELAKEAEVNALLLERRRAEEEVLNPSAWQSAKDHGWRDTSSGNPDSARRVKMVKVIDGVEYTIIINRPARPHFAHAS